MHINNPAFLVMSLLLGGLIILFLMSLAIYRSKWSAKLDHQLLREIELLDTERSRISNDLHDEIAPHLTLAGVYVEKVKTEDEKNLAYLKNAMEFLQSSMSKLGEIVKDLSPTILERQGLKSALYGVVEKSAAGTGINIEFDYDVPIVIKPQKGLHIYRMVQEVVQNGIKHSGAKQIDVRIFEEGSNIIILYKDNGKGFIANSKPGHGTKSLQDRIRALKGDMDLVTGEGKGTDYSIRIPIKAIYEQDYQNNRRR